MRDITVFYTYVGLTYVVGDKMGKFKTTAEIWKVKADGSENQRLFAEKLSGDWNVTFRSLRVSHSGQRLVFIEHVDKWGYMSAVTSSLWVMNADGTDLSELVGHSKSHPRSATWSDYDEGAFLIKESPVSPVWSPDDTLIAFVDYYAVPHEPGEVGILDIESGRWRKLGEGEILDWSPNGDALAVYSNTDYAASSDLRILNLDGTIGSVVKWSSLPTLESLDWSPVTGHVVAQSMYGAHPIFLINPYTGSSEVVVEEGYNAHGYSPQWSPDGKMISYVRTNGGQENLYVMDLDSRDVRLVLPQVGSEGAWSPDSELILVQSEVEGAGLYVVSVSDGQYWKIPNTEGDGNEAWWPSQTWVFSQ